MPDPSLSLLPPEWVGAIRDVLMASGHEHRTEAVVEAVAPLLDAILVARDERWQHQLATKVGEHQECCRDRSRLEAEARSLREAAERALTNIRDGAPGIAASILSAALSASPEPERRPDGDSWMNERVAEHLRGRFETSRSWVEVAYDARSIFTGHGPPLNDDLSAPRDGRPVTVPEQEEERCENCRGSGHWQREGGGQDVTRPCPVCSAAASSSSSEAGPRVVISGGGESVTVRPGEDRDAALGELAVRVEASEEGERAGDAAAIGLITDALLAERLAEPDAAGVRERAAIVFETLRGCWLRERLTSDEFIAAWRRAVCTVPVAPWSSPDETLRARFAAAADYLDNRTEGGRHG